jgi:GAF domain-containing protein
MSADALSELARVWRRYEGDPDGAIRAITETGCTAIDVARCSVWLLSDDHRSLRCADLYERATGQHSSGIVLEATAYPAYFAALESEEPIAAFDAHTDPRTAEFSPGYLRPLNIGAMLDAPLRTGGRLVGVVCNEHIGDRRDWTTSAQRDAAFLASLTSLALELAQRARREALLAATLESTGEGIVAVDGEKVVAFNRRFLEMWGVETPPREVAPLQAHMRARTTDLDRFIADASDILSAPESDTVDVIQLVDGRVFERTGRPQRLRGDIVGRVWSFRDVTLQRRAEAALRASEAHLRDLAIKDGLTGLFNRRFALEQLATALTHAATVGERVAVALIDVDFFKQVNDRHGHLVGRRSAARRGPGARRSPARQRPGRALRRRRVRGADAPGLGRAGRRGDRRAADAGGRSPGQPRAAALHVLRRGLAVPRRRRRSDDAAGPGRRTAVRRQARRPEPGAHRLAGGRPVASPLSDELRPAQPTQ